MGKNSLKNLTLTDKMRIEKIYFEKNDSISSNLVLLKLQSKIQFNEKIRPISLLENGYLNISQFKCEIFGFKKKIGKKKK